MVSSIRFILCNEQVKDLNLLSRRTAVLPVAHQSLVLHATRKNRYGNIYLHNVIEITNCAIQREAPIGK